MAWQTGAHLHIELLVMWLKQSVNGDIEEGRKLYAL